MKLTLDYPLRPYHMTQKFGDNGACAQNINLPVTQRKITSKVLGVCLPGYVELYPLLGMKGHTGMDFLAFHAQRLYHCGPDGTVEELQTEPERGLGIGIISKEKYDFGEYEAQAKVRYWHLKNFTVKLGDFVKRGDLIGYCDNTGISSGDHLHFELKPVTQNKENGVFSNIFQTNGYFGSIDPLPYFTGEFAQDKKKIGTGQFLVDIKYGTRSDEVKRLQEVLGKLGYFTYPENTGYYGEYTRKAVYDFQLDYVNLSFWEKWFLNGKAFGPKSRIAINKITT